MPFAAMNEQERTRSDAKRAAALASLFAAFAITLLKLITAVLTGSVGMLSESAHSAIDLLAAAMTTFTVRVSDLPADEEHTYGHGKVENLSAAFEVILMVGSCLWIGTESVRRIIFHRHLALTWSPWPFVVLLLSIAVDWSRSRALRRVAREQRSDALAADAIHFSTDIWSSLAVLLGLLASFLGQRFGIRALEYADPVAALVVALIILRITWTLAHSTANSLLDATPLEVREQIGAELVRELEATPDVISVGRVRVRRSGSNYFVDLTLGLPRTVTFQRSEQITFAATASVRARLPGADVVIHTVPTASVQESVFDRLRAIAARANLAIHDLSVQQLEDGLHVEQHVEMDENLSLRHAHDRVTALEAEMRLENPSIADIVTHIESEPATIQQPQPLTEGVDTLKSALQDGARSFPEIIDIHNIIATQTADGVQMRCHCTLPDDLSMHRVHLVMSELEATFRAAHPAVTRLLIHPEPATDNTR